MVLLGSCPYLFITLRGETCVPKEEIEGYMEVRRRIGQKKNRIGKWEEGVRGYEDSRKEFSLPNNILYMCTQEGIPQGESRDRSHTIKLESHTKSEIRDLPEILTTLHISIAL